MDVGVRELDSCVPEELVIFDLAEGLALPRYQLAGMGPEIVLKALPPSQPISKAEGEM
ncbi:hypothetical protein FRC19_006034, partial [Serendipita sp. 401]